VNAATQAIDRRRRLYLQRTAFSFMAGKANRRVLYPVHPKFGDHFAQFFGAASLDDISYLTLQGQFII
jgi:hypothetical protein